MATPLECKHTCAEIDQAECALRAYQVAFGDYGKILLENRCGFIANINIAACVCNCVYVGVRLHVCLHLSVCTHVFVYTECVCVCVWALAFVTGRLSESTFVSMRVRAHPGRGRGVVEWRHTGNELLAECGPAPLHGLCSPYRSQNCSIYSLHNQNSLSIQNASTRPAQSFFCGFAFDNDSFCSFVSGGQQTI